jgi:hypothetical protein
MPAPFVAPLPIAVLDMDDSARLMLQVVGDGSDLEIGTQVERCDHVVDRRCALGESLERRVVERIGKSETAIADEMRIQDGDLRRQTQPRTRKNTRKVKRPQRRHHGPPPGHDGVGSRERERRDGAGFARLPGERG